MIKYLCPVTDENMPEEVKNEITNIKGLEYVRVIDIEHNSYEMPDGSQDTDAWTVTTYDPVSCMLRSRTWCINYYTGERNVSIYKTEVSLGDLRKWARLVGEVA